MARTRGLKSKSSHSFNFQRLISIYSTLFSILNLKKKGMNNNDFNIELISDVNTLIHLNLLTYVQISQFNFMSRKLVSNIGIDFAKKIADDFEIKLDDFINIDYY